MLMFKCYIDPFGDENERRTLSTILIANVGGDSPYYNYAFVISEKKPIVGEAILVSGVIRDYFRSAPVTDILHAVLAAYKGKDWSTPKNTYEKAVVSLLLGKATSEEEN